MASQEHFLVRLLDLPHVDDAAARRAIFRQTIAALGLGRDGGGPMALAGVDPNRLGDSMTTALADGLLEDLAFITPAAAAVALYQIAGALPLGTQRRAVGRKVLGYLYKGDVDTFASLASRMALGSTRPLKGSAIRARVSLALEVPTHAQPTIDRLALAIVSRRELATEWVSHAATGSLPDRRLAARLLQRAAREAARRAETGDRHALKIFAGAAATSITKAPAEPFDAIAAAWHTLLADRETLVWRHVAIARGFLSEAIPELGAQIEADLDPQLTPTEWRRAATSLVTRIIADRRHSLRDAMDALDGPLFDRDPGIAMAMVWGLEPVAQIEPEAAEDLLEAIASVSPISVAESLAALRRQVPGFGDNAAKICAAAIHKSLARPELDDGLASLARNIEHELTTGGESQVLLCAVEKAIRAFAEKGTRQAHALAAEAQALAAEHVAALSALEITYDADMATAKSRQEAMLLLRELDSALLESRSLNNLLLLDAPPGASAAASSPLDELDDKLADWLFNSKRRSATPEEVRTQATLHQRQLRALLHLIDSGRIDYADDHDRRGKIRMRWTHACRVLVGHIHKQPGSRLTRAIIATVARAFDALVRDGAAEVVDVLLFAAASFSDPAHIGIIAEASMHPDVTILLGSYHRFVTTNAEDASAEHARIKLEAFSTFLDAFPSQTTLRAEAFRTTAWTLVHALRAVIAAGSLAALVPRNSAAVDASPLAAIEDAIDQLQQLVLGAERRCSDRVGKQRAVLPPRHSLAHAIENAVNTESESGLLEALTQTARAADATLPTPISRLVTGALPRLARLPLTDADSEAIAAPAPIQLPGWLPSRRILGGYYVIRQIGGGNVGTVFVVKRAEDRHDTEAERFALKVPEYNATAARTMSEDEFLKLFREEAGALLAIPDHPNIARFVTFDAGAKPKPILVMDLIEGVSCERIINTRSLVMDKALRVLDDTLAGLGAMHSAGIAHLDVKPSNTVIRDKDGASVLVDFGLAGRKLRPGCATLCYGAPEVWEGVSDGDEAAGALAADVYAFGCFAYEVMTTATLFDGNSDVAVIAGHIQHDGLPPGVAALANQAQLQPFAMFLHQCLRHEPSQRASVGQLRKELTQLRKSLDSQPWPLPISAE